MVWIHGGGFLRGNGQPSIPGSIRNIVNRGVVLVLIQYRLGVFGLFQQAIMESGTAHLCFEDSLGPTYQDFRFVSRACGFTFDMWNSGNYSMIKECLMNMDPDHLIGYQMAADGPVPNALCYNMVQDNYFFPGTPRTLAKNRKNIPTIIGTNKDEWGTFELIYIMNSPTKLTNYTREFSEFRLTQVFSNFLGDQTQDALRLLENLYLGSNITDSDNLAWLNFVVDIGTTFFWTGPVGRDVHLNLQNNNPDVYVYEFTYYSGADSHKTFPGWTPVTHGAETSFLFMGWGENDLEQHKLNISDVNIANLFGEAWTNFAKTGKPTTDGSWKPATSAINNTAYYEIGWNSGARPAYRNLDQIQYNEILPTLLGVETPRIKPDYNNGSLLGCPITFFQGKVNSHHCYSIFNTSMTQPAATSYCAQFFTGSKTALKNIDNAFENSELLS
uniref:Carboxylesterase type B domain-containing protein n=1 Tax=Acrobeloides nanus TaxID=290746 RepID=A0A914ECE8_9BILA